MSSNFRLLLVLSKKKTDGELIQWKLFVIILFFFFFPLGHLTVMAHLVEEFRSVHLLLALLPTYFFSIYFHDWIGGKKTKTNHQHITEKSVPLADSGSSSCSPRWGFCAGHVQFIRCSGALHPHPRHWLLEWLERNGLLCPSKQPRYSSTPQRHGWNLALILYYLNFVTKVTTVMSSPSSRAWPRFLEKTFWWCQQKWNYSDSAFRGTNTVTKIFTRHFKA